MMTWQSGKPEKPFQSPSPSATRCRRVATPPLSPEARKCLLLLFHGTPPHARFQPPVGRRSNALAASPEVAPPPRARRWNLPMGRPQVVRRNADPNVLSWTTDAAVEKLGQARKSGVHEYLYSPEGDLECEAPGFQAT
jgi:hypothetical protein